MLAAWMAGSVWAVAMPPLAYVDEDSHVVYAVAIAHGDLVGQDHVGVVGEGADARNSTLTAVEVPQAYVGIGDLPACHKFNWEADAGCAPEPPPSPGRIGTALTPAGTYPPAYYAATGVPSRLLSPPAALLAMRLVSALLVAAAVAVAVASMRAMEGPGWRWLGLAFAFPPMAAHLAGGVNPNGLEVALSVAVWASALEVFGSDGDPTRWARWRLAGSAAGLVMTRPLSVVWLVVALVLVLATTADRRAVVASLRAPRLRIVWTAIGLAVLVAGAWLVLRGTLSAFNGVPADVTFLEAVRTSLTMWPGRLEEMVGRLGWMDVILPRHLVLLPWVVVVALLVLLAALRATPRHRLVLALMVAAIVVLPVLAEARAAGRIGFAWQGRYTLPVAAGLPVLAGWIADRTARDRALPQVVVGAGLAVWAAIHVVALAATLTRYEVGYPRAPVAFLRGGTGWEPPVHDVALVGAYALVMSVPATFVLYQRWVLR